MNKLAGVDPPPIPRRATDRDSRKRGKTVTEKVINLEAASASITTATVTIKAVQVNRKQMTQSVFRQLPVTPLVDEENVVLLGEPWGYVNYYWGDISTRCTHFLFQHDGKLFRDAFHVRPSTDFRKESRGPLPYLELREAWVEEAGAIHRARILEGWEPDKEKRSLSSKSWSAWIRSESFGSEYIDNLPSCTTIMRSDVIEDAIDYARKEYEYRSKSPMFSNNPHPRKSLEEVLSEQRTQVESSIEDARKALSEGIVTLIGVAATAAEIECRIRKLERSAEEYFRRWDILMDELSRVEQLFIAV